MSNEPETLTDIAHQIIKTDARGFSRRAAGKYDWITAANYALDGDFEDLIYFLDREALVDYYENYRPPEECNEDWCFDDWIENCWSTEEAAFKNYGIDTERSHKKGGGYDG